MRDFKNLARRGLSLFIALMMCLSLLSVTAFAEDGEETQVEEETQTEPEENTDVESEEEDDSEVENQEEPGDKKEAESEEENQVGNVDQVGAQEDSEEETGEENVGTSAFEQVEMQATLFSLERTESFQDVIDAAARSGGTVTLENDITESIVIRAGQNIILNLGGYTLTNTEDEHTITVEEGGTLTIEGSGTVDNVSHRKAALNNEGTIREISGCTFMRSAENKQTDGTGNNSYYTVRNIGTIELISGGTFENKGTFSSCFINGDYQTNPENKGTIGKITGGTFKGGKIALKNDPNCVIGDISGTVIEGSNIYNKYSFIALLNYGTIGTVTNTVITSSGQAVCTSGNYNDAEITLAEGVKATAKNNTLAVIACDNKEHKSITKITGGEYYAVKPEANYQTLSGAPDTLIISGGKFSLGAKSTVEPCMTQGMKWTEEGAVVIDTEKMVAKIGEEYYTTLQKAITKAQNGDTVTLLKNVEEDIIVEAEKNVTLDLNGKTLKGVKGHTITNKGTLTIKDSSGATEKKAMGKIVGMNIGGKPKVALMNEKDATCTIESGMITRQPYLDGEAQNDTRTNSNYTIRNNGTMNITGGKIANNSEKSAMVSNNGAMTISGTAELESTTYTAIQSQPNCTLDISGGHIKGGSEQGLSLYGTTNISGEANIEAWIRVWTYAFRAKGNTNSVPQPESILNISGGTITDTQLQAVNGLMGFDPQSEDTDKDSALWAEKGTTKAQINITGGTFSLTGGVMTARIRASGDFRSFEKVENGDVAEINISGGTFTTNVQEYCLEDYVAIVDGDNTYTVVSHAANDHSWTAGNSTATCTAAGTADYTCTICGKAETRSTPALGHAYGEWTAAEDGTHTRVCARDASHTESHAASWDEGVVTVEPTYSSTGVRTYTCAVCGLTREETIARRYSGGSSSGGSNRRPGGGSTTAPSTTIPENPTPLAPTVDVEDEDTPLAGLPGFLDVKPGDWFYDAVVYVYGHGLMNGVSGTAFAPGDSTLRGMIVTVLHRMEDTPDANPADFLDVLEGQYYFDAVGWGTANEIVKGYGNGLFGPEDTITREQLAAILYRYAQFKGYDVSARADLSAYADAGQISAYAVEAMQWAVAEELINGVTDTLLAPRSHATRAQIATILMRFEENIAA